MAKQKRSLAKPPPGAHERILLGKFESESSPGTWHEVRLGADNQMYCTCRGWCNLRPGQTERTCPHVRNVLAAMNRLQPGGLRLGKATEPGNSEFAAFSDGKRAFLPFDDEEEK